MDFDADALKSQLASKGISFDPSGGGGPPAPQPPTQGIQGIPELTAKLQGAGLVPPPMQAPPAPIGPPPPPSMPAKSAPARDLHQLARDEEATSRAAAKVDQDTRAARIASMSPAERERAMASMHDVNVSIQEPPANGMPGPGGPPGADQPYRLAMPQGPTLVKAHYDRSRDPLTDKTYGLLDEAYTDQAKAGLASARAQELGADALAQHYDNVAREEQDRAARWQAQENERQAKVDQARTAANQASDQAAKLSVDPQRFMKSTNTAQGIMMAIGGALGGLLQGMHGGSNPFMDYLDRTIDRDVKSQETDVEQKRWRANQADQNFQQLRQEMGDDRSADLAQRDQYYAYAESQVKALLSRTQSKDAQARGEAVLADLGMKRAGLAAQRDQARYVAAHTVGGMAAPKKDLANVFMNTDGKRYIARNPESRKIIAESAITTANVVSGGDDYAAALKDVGPADRAAFKIGIKTAAMAKAQTAYNHALSPVRQAQNDGTWKKGAVAMFEETLVPPQDYTGNPVQQAELIKKQAMQMHDHVMRVEDAVPVETGFGVDQHGQLAPQAAYTGEQQDPMRVGMPKGAKKLGGQ